MRVFFYEEGVMGYDLWALAISALSLVVAGIALGWNIFRDCIDRPKLKLNVFVANLVDSNGRELPQVISVTVTNVGRKAIVIKGHGFLMKDKTKLIFPEIMVLFDQKRLEPYDHLNLTLPNSVLLNLVEKADLIRAFFVYDTTGKWWKLGGKIFSQFKQSLKAKKQNSCLWLWLKRLKQVSKPLE